MGNERLRIQGLQLLNISEKLPIRDKMAFESNLYYLMIGIDNLDKLEKQNKDLMKMVVELKDRNMELMLNERTNKGMDAFAYRIQEKE